jgi:predicted DNA-binding protein
MTTLQITLTDNASQALNQIAARTGKTTEELLHEAVERFLEESSQLERLRLLRQARGMWKDRDDLPSLEMLRRELDRF